MPTEANGGVSADRKTVVWKLREGLRWSDGSPVTAADIVFTTAYCPDPGGGGAQATRCGDVATVRAIDDLTVEVVFKVAKFHPYGPFVGAASPILQEAQFAGCAGSRAPRCRAADTRPVGTGPFRVIGFRANDRIELEANPHYRDAARPDFATVLQQVTGKSFVLPIA